MLADLIWLVHKSQIEAGMTFSLFLLRLGFVSDFRSTGVIGELDSHFGRGKCATSFE
jgi:hypothetical protein